MLSVLLGLNYNIQMFVKIMTKIIKLCKTFLSEEYISDLEYHKYIASFTVENRPLILITLILRKNHQCRRIPVLKSAPKIIKIQTIRNRVLAIYGKTSEGSSSVKEVFRDF